MVRIDNKDTLRLLTNRFMKTNRKRNIIAIISIMLTSLLFTSLFVGSESLILSQRATEIRQSMDASHAVVQNLTGEDGEKALKALKRDQDVERFGQSIFLGIATNPELNFQTEIRYADDNMAESFCASPTTGTLPQADNEIAVSTLVLDALQVPHKLGEKLTITWENGDRAQMDTFVLSGYWKGDKALLAQHAWVSEAYAKANCGSLTREDIENGLDNGSYEYAVWYRNLWHLQEKTDALSKAAGLFDSDYRFEVNPAYDMMQEDTFSFPSLAVMVLLIVLAGYLIIYNIFHISVKTDIRTYGLLKNVGTTGKQLKKIVRMQALRLSLIGIPLGMAAGYIVARIMAPFINASGVIASETANATTVVVCANPLLFLIAAILTLITVYLSCIQSCHIVESVSPIEAMQLSENDHSVKAKGNKKIHTGKGKFSTTWFGMAVQNMTREWKKGLIVMLSIALTMVVVNCVIMLVNGYDFDAYKEALLSSDFKLDRLSANFDTSDLEGITQQVQEELNACPYSKETGYVYYSPQTHKMEDFAQEAWEEAEKEYEEDLCEEDRKTWEKILKSKTINVHLIGINEAAFQKLQWQGEPCTWEDFASGDYAVFDASDRYYDTPIACYNKGDRFSMQYDNGKTKDYQIMGEALVPYSMDYPFYDNFFITIIIPESEFIENTGNHNAMLAGIDAKDGQVKQVQQYLESTVKKENDTINVLSVLDMRECFQKYINKYYSIGALLTVVLLLIAIMNFSNTTATSILSRKRELTLLEAVGMTRKMMLKMLIAEGFLYFIGAFVIAIIIICCFSERLLYNTFGGAFFFEMHLTIVPCICMIPFFFIIAVIIPYYQYRKLEGQSIVERLRTE